MSRLLILFLILIFGFTADDLRKEIIIISWQRTNDPGNRTGYTFQDAAYLTPAGQIPYYFKSVIANHPRQDFQFTIENPVFESVSIDHPDQITGEWPTELTLHKTNLQSGNSRMTQIQIPAMIRKDDEILLLKKFELKQIPIQLKAARATRFNWKTESVLKDGKWVKISTTEKGIHKIPWSTLMLWGFSDPSTVKVFGAGGTILSEDPGKIIYDDLPQIPVWHGKNNGTDCLFFYAPGTIQWVPDPSGKYFTRSQNCYTTKGHFFLSEDAGNTKNVEISVPPTEPATQSISTFDEYAIRETDRYNLIQSGRQWFGDKLMNGSTRNYSFTLTDPANPEELSLFINTAARSSFPSRMVVTANQNSTATINYSKVSIDCKECLFAHENSLRMPVASVPGNLDVSLRYLSGDDNAEAWLDYMIINYRRKIRQSNEKPVYFRDIDSHGPGQIVEFTVEAATPDLKVWDVTNLFDVREVPLQFNGNNATGKIDASELRELAAFSPGNQFPEPELAGAVANQNLHGLDTPEFLIITHPSFLKQANELADFHRTRDAMQTEVVSSQAVYNEFSSGNSDATGLRNFIKMLYDRNKRLKYVLLFGDGSYDNRRINPGSLSFIPTYQSISSLEPVTSFVTDDYYALLDPGESVYNGAVDLGIGRLPASTGYQADLMVRKNREYNSPQAFGDWRNKLCFIADDEDDNMHMEDSEKLANLVNANHNDFLIEKIYFDAYPQITGPGGESYPEVTDAINQKVNEGVLILNYVGHANTRYLAKENVLDVSHINSWSNRNTMPIFVTATCEFSRFDADEISAGEYILFNQNGGGIGLFSTTRLVFAYSNYLLSRSFYTFVFQKDNQGNPYRMGDIMRLAKVNTANTINKRNFSLLANPALKLSIPQHKVVTTSINGHDATLTSDTLGALQYVTVNGHIADESDQKQTNFNGRLVSTVFEKAQMVKTRGNGGEQPMQFKVQENIIYRGATEVRNGEFAFSFVIPKDISYAIGNGKIMYYADNGVTDASGAFENFLIGGPANDIVDNQGPQIELFLDSEDFTSGDKVSRNPLLLARLSDENGINTAGSGIGHDITAVISSDPSNVLVVNNHYQAEINDHTTGTIRYQLKNLPLGKHRLKLKAWDVANNSSEQEIEFEVTDDFVISAVSCYPNPMADHTFISFEHNQANAPLETIFEVFDANGRRIDHFISSVGSNGTISNPIRWDLSQADMPIRSGLYIYRITARNADGNITSKSGKLVVGR